MLIIAAIAIGVTTDSSSRIGEIVVPPATVTLATPEARTDEERAYLDVVLPLTERLVGEGRLLTALGTERSRNVFELTVRADRFQGIANEIRAFETTAGVPPGLTWFSTALHDDLDDAEAAIDEAKAAFVRFDWDTVQTAVTAFGEAVDAIASATTLLEPA